MCAPSRGSAILHCVQVICVVWTLIAPDKNASWLLLRTAMSKGVPVLDGVKASSPSLLVPLPMLACMAVVNCLMTQSNGSASCHSCWSPLIPGIDEMQACMCALHVGYFFMGAQEIHLNAFAAETCSQSTRHVCCMQIEESPEEAAQMKKALRVTLWWALALSIITFLLWPLLTLAAGTVWSEGYFTFWIILSIVWGLVAGAMLKSSLQSASRLVQVLM